MDKKKYRPELDGIRAISVIAVIFYHAELTLLGKSVFPGGFLGVDVFFVLSGFLITGILQERKIGILNFYKSRVDRIFPALVLILFLSCIYAFLFLLPKEVVALADSLNSALGFYANYFFMGQDAYVAESSKTNPLLHTWSLGVEWQFYLLFPILFILVNKEKNLFLILFVIFVASLFYCLHLLDVDKNKAFYHSLSRFWEIMVGCGVYIFSQKIKFIPFREIFSWLGVITIFISFFYFNDADRHPGWISFTVTVAIALVILCVKEESRLYHLLSHPVMVWVGVLSYAIYLIHQPVFAFYRMSNGDLDWVSFAMLSMLIVGLAYAIWRWYEKPLRYSQGYRKYVLLTGLALAVIGFSWFAKERDGFMRSKPADISPSLLVSDVIDFRRLQGKAAGVDFSGAKKLESCINRTPETACYFGEKIRLVNIGDSFAAVFDFGLHAYFGETGFMTQTYQQCPLLDAPLWFGTVPECWEINKKRWEVLKKLDPSVVVLSNNFEQFNRAKTANDSYSAGMPQNDNQVDSKMVWKSFENTLHKIIEMGHQPLVINQPPSPDYNIEQKIRRRIYERRWDGEAVWGAKPDKRFNREIKVVLNNVPKAKLFDVHEKLCGFEKGCILFNRYGPMFEVGNHLSGNGVDMLIDDLSKNINNLNYKNDVD